MENNKFAHRNKLKYLENFYKIMYGKKKIITKIDEYEYEASYFAMCLLLPKDIFMKMVDVFGGIEKVSSSKEYIAALSRLFFVEEELVKVRIKDIYSDELEKKHIKKLKP